MSSIRKYIYLGIFIFATIVIFNITNDMLRTGFDTAIGIMKASDKRLAFGLIATFGIVGYFVETVLQKLNNTDKKSVDKINEEN